MATNDKQLIINSLEFDGIKENMKTFLKGNPEFLDYEFEGSSMSVFLDVMAYTTHYLGYHTNMVINESFLDTAVLRNSVVSHAKAIGYIPKSVTASNAIIKLSFDLSGLDIPTYIMVEKGQTFTSTVSGVAQTFTAIETTNIFPDEAGDFSGEITIHQGALKGVEWTYDAESETQQFLLRDAGADRDTITVTVNGIPWRNDRTLSDLDNDSLEFFLQEGLDSVTELYFGNTVFGKRPQNNQVIHMEYLQTRGVDGNYGSSLRDQVFSLDTAIAGTYDANRVIIETISVSSHGSAMESTESIRSTAPKSYERQNRAVTAEDYKTILLEAYPNIDSIAVWGGEDNVPPQYGAVFISIKPKYGLELSPLTKTKITDDILSKYNILAVTPLIVLPEYTFVDITTQVKYDALSTAMSAGELQTKIMDDVSAFFADELGQFRVTLRYSQLTGTIDAVDPSISNNLTSMKIYKKFYIQASNTIGNYVFKFNNPITPGATVSSVFGSVATGTQMALLDDGQGTILLYDIITESFLSTSQGSVNYDTGEIELIGFNPTIDDNSPISLYATPKSNDVHTLRNNLLILNSTEVEMITISE